MLNTEPKQARTVTAAIRGRPLRRLALAGLAALLIAALGVAGLAWQAARDTLSLDFFKSRIEQVAQARLPTDAGLAIGGIAVSYRGAQGVILTARDVRLAAPGKAMVTADELAFVTTLPAVLRRRVELSSLTASGVDVRIAAPAGLQASSAPAETIRNAGREIVAAIIGADDALRSAGLGEVAVRDAALHVLDRSGRPGPPLTIAEANWRPFGSGRSKAWLQVVEAGGGGWDLTLERRRGRLGSASVQIEIEDLPVSTLVPRLAAGDGEPFRPAITLQARLSTARDGSFSSLRGVLSVTEGDLPFGRGDRIRFAGAAVSFALGATGDRIAIPSGEIRTRSGGILFEAVADVSRAGALTLLGRVRSGVLPTDRADRPVGLTGGGALVRIDFRKRSLEVERLHLVTAEGTVSVIGQAGHAGPAAGLSFAVSFTEMPAKIARAFWPPFVAAETRQWFDLNVKSGIVGPSTLRVALPPDAMGAGDRVLPDSALAGSVPFRDAEFSPFPKFRTISQATGEIAFADAAATVRAQSGLVVVEGKGELQAGGTVLVIPELGGPAPRGDLHLELSGPAAALAALSDAPPLAVAARRGISANALSGEAQLTLDAQLPFDGGSLDDVEPTFRLALSDFSSTSPIADRRIEDADLMLEGTPDGVAAKGTGILDGIRASIDIVLDGSAAGRSDVMLALDDAARERLGLGLGDLLTGPVQASVKASDSTSRTVSLDLKDARISLPFLGWEKGPGVPAAASFVMATTEAGIRITDLAVSGKGFGAKGSLSIGPHGELREIELTELALRPGDRISVTATAAASGYDVRVRGRALDARGILRDIAGPRGGRPGMFPLRIALDIDAVTGRNDVVLSGVAGSMVVTGAGLETVSLKGRAAKAPFEWTLEKDGEARVLRVFADDGGALIRFAGIYARVAGGNLILDYSGEAGGAGTGVMVMRDFRLLDEPALAPALETARQAASRTAAARSGAPDWNDLVFNQLRIPFRQEDWVISLEDAALRGTILGATGSGTINVPGSRIAISGTLIPAFGINNIAGAIPFIGGILGGGRDEGLFGITYKLFGPLDDPQLAMNPISAIAPGIFRRIFEYN